MRSHGRLRKRMDELQALLAGAPPPGEAPFDPVQSLRDVARRAGRAATEVDAWIDLLVPAVLPDLRGDEGRFVDVLLRMTEARLASGDGTTRVTLAARALVESEKKSILVSISEALATECSEPFADEPVVLESIAVLGAEVRGAAHPRIGRTTLLHFSMP